MKDNIKIGSRVKCRCHASSSSPEGVVYDFKWINTKTMPKIMVGVKFDTRWHWNMNDKNEMYFNYNDIKKIEVRVFTLEDPYGEENWDD